MCSDNKEVSCHKYKCFNTILSLESETNTNTNMKKICTNAPIRCIEFKIWNLLNPIKISPPRPSRPNLGEKLSPARSLMRKSPVWQITLRKQFCKKWNYKCNCASGGFIYWTFEDHDSVSVDQNNNLELFISDYTYLKC